ncbi:helix-turn-helix transcriptional regulator [Paenibacillus sp. 2RAB27]|uniref:helix-turn-helix transcriptional regulator n=1 Tax=Paenibacillus sp. 2RAB27 TaxID=3232991 RepID=UPI003F95CD48
MLKQRNDGCDHFVMTAIETIEDADLLFISELTVWFVLSAYLELIRNGSDVLIRTGDIFVLNKGDMVRVIGSAENATLTVKFLINEYQEEFPPFKLNIPLSMVYKKDGYELVRNCMAYLYIEMSYPGDGSDYMIEGYSKRLIGLLYRYIGLVDEREQAHAATDKVKEIVSYINLNYGEKLSLDKIAEKFYSSKYYLAHSFKNQLGISIGNYIKEVRLFHSYRMLGSTNDKIVTIALANGFSNVRSFNEAFKEKYKVTPAEFREENQIVNVRNREERAPEEYKRLLGYEPPQRLWDPKRDLGLNDTIAQAKYKNWLGKTIYGVVIFFNKFFDAVNKPLLANNVYFVMNMPFRQIDRFSGGKISRKQILTLLRWINR